MVKRIDGIIKEGNSEERSKSSSEKVDKYRKLHNYLTEETFENKGNRLNFALGMIQEEMIIKLKELLERKVSSSKIRQAISKASLDFQKQFRKISWKHKCNITVEIDKLLGLDLRIKKKKIRKTQQKDEKEDKEKDQQENRSEEGKKKEKGKGKKREGKKSGIEMYIEKIDKIGSFIQDFIGSGKKWLELR